MSLLKHLQYSSNSDCGKNMNHFPSRMVPVSISYEDDNKSVIFILPNNGEMKIILEKRVKVPEPPAYFLGRHSFIKSYLYLSSMDFYSICHFPKRSDSYVEDFLKKTMRIEKEADKNKGKIKKMIQNILSSDILDTDPHTNIYFSILFETLPNIIIVRTNSQGYFSKTIPSKLPELTTSKTENPCFILLQLPNKKFCPYGKAFIK